MSKYPLYTVQKDKQKRIHGSTDAQTTTCGVEITNGNWFILSNDYSESITCKKCLGIIKESDNGFPVRKRGDSIC